MASNRPSVNLAHKHNYDVRYKVYDKLKEEIWYPSLYQIQKSHTIVFNDEYSDVLGYIVTHNKTTIGHFDNTLEAEEHMFNIMRLNGVEI